MHYRIHDVNVVLVDNHKANTLATHPGEESTCLNTVQITKFSIKDFFSKCDEIHSFLRIWSYLLKNFIFCAVNNTGTDTVKLKIFKSTSKSSNNI